MHNGGCAWVVSVKQREQPRNNLYNFFIFLANWVVGQFLKKMRIGGNMSMNACARKGNGWWGGEATLKNGE